MNNDVLYERSDIQNILRELCDSIEMCFDDGVLVDQERVINLIDDLRSEWEL